MKENFLLNTHQNQMINALGIGHERISKEYYYWQVGEGTGTYDTTYDTKYSYWMGKSIVSIKYCIVSLIHIKISIKLTELLPRCLCN